MPVHRSAASGYGAILLEVSSIVLAIVLGFAVTNWNEARQERERADAAMDRMRQELETNLAALEDVLPYHRRTVATIDSVIETDGNATFMSAASLDVPGWNGIRPPRLRTASFMVATSSGALGHVEFEQADAIAAAYESVQDVETGADRVLGAIIEGNVHRLSDVSLQLSVLGELEQIARYTIRRALEPEGSREQSPNGDGTSAEDVAGAPRAGGSPVPGEGAGEPH